MILSEEDRPLRDHTTTGDITELLQDWRRNSPGAIDRLMPLVVEELRALAQGHFRREGEGHTLQPNALINELYLLLLAQHSIRFENRTEFFAFASRLLRRILVDHYRKKQKAKRGGGSVRITLDDALVKILDETTVPAVDLLALGGALQGLAALDSRQHRLVELRYFGGLTQAQTARAMGLSEATIKREWNTARAWLRRRIEN